MKRASDTTVHVGILQTDSVLPQFQPDFGDYPQMIRDVLMGTGEALRFSTFEVCKEVYPDHIHQCDAYVITGSKASVYDDVPWIHRLCDFVVELHQKKIKTVGICFGHQLIAHALGGKTESAAVGWGVGVHQSDIVGTSGFMLPEMRQYRLLYSHKDQVVQLPPGAELLATNDFCPNAMFLLGDHMLAVQGHPEFEKGYSRALIEYRQEVLGKETFTRGLASLSEDTDEATVARWLINFMRSD